MSEVSEPAAGQPERSDPVALRQALAEAVERASGAAELARLITDYQRRLEEVARSEAEALTKVREAEARLKTAERQNAQLAKQLAEQKYQTEVANWKFASLQESRWSKLGDAIHSKKPGTVARTLKAPIRKRPAPRRSDFTPEIPAIPEVKAAPAAPEPKAPQVSAPLAESFTVPKGPTARPYMTVAAIVDRQTEALLRYEWRLVTNFGPDNWEAMLDQQPHVLFVESVRPGPRQGNGGRWLEALAGETRALRDLVAACHKRGSRRSSGTPAARCRGPFRRPSTSSTCWPPPRPAPASGGRRCGTTASACSRSRSSPACTTPSPPRAAGPGRSSPLARSPRRPAARPGSRWRGRTTTRRRTTTC
ncbi:hypothetical protein GCM10027612_28800 [Microbispora bryophytorum subsp. camponoti]